MSKLTYILVHVSIVLITEGALATPSMVKDINPGIGNSSPQYLTDVNGSLFFSAKDGTNGIELWKFDKGTITVLEAAINGLIHPYCYYWNGSFYDFINADDRVTDIEPWQGFWVIVRQSVDLTFRRPVDSPTIDQFDFDPDRYYQFSIPLVPTAGGDIGTIFGPALGQYEVDYRVAKYDYATDESQNYYTGPGSIPDLLPGRGFWLQHIHYSTKTVVTSGTPVTSAGVDHKLKLPSNGQQLTYHMVGNPYWENIQWGNCWIQAHMYGNLPLAKPAVIAQNEIETWHIGLALESSNGKSIDPKNRAGVVINSPNSHEWLRAFDLVPPGDYIRLTLNDPLNPYQTPLAYDYRAPGMDEYTWEVELTTTYDDIDVQFTLDNIDFVPTDYIITLLDNESGEAIEIGGDRSINLTLSSGAPKTYILTAAMKPTAVEEAAQPTAFGITSISPNPFNPSTTVDFALENPGNVLIKIYNLNGQHIETVVNTYMTAGSHSVMWNAAGFSSGIYFVSFESNGLKYSQKITLMK